MCFSASASLSAAAVLAVTGVVALRSVRDKRWFPVALIPVLFAVQQGLEGIIWLFAGGEHAELVQVCTYGFLLFALVLWPTWIPVSMLSIENGMRRKTLLKIMVWAGAGVSVVLAYTFATHIPAATIQGCHVHYALFYTGSWAGVLAWVYAFTTVGPFFASSQPGMRVLGTLIFVSCLAAFYFYTEYFTSVWCFFAAVISTSVVMLIKRKKL